MQGVREATRSETGRNPGPHVSPGKAFVILGVVLVAAGVALLVTRPDSAPPSSGISESKNFALTDAEAIDRFSELHESLLMATRHRDASELSDVLTQDGHAMKKAIAAIEELEKDNVTDRTSVETLNLRVRVNSPAEIAVIQQSVLTPCFLSPHGKDITTSHDRIARTVKWTLIQTTGTWLIDRADLISEKTVNASDHCP
jgi:hypothetical protein